MAEIYQLPETGTGCCNSGFNGIPFSIPLNGLTGNGNGGWGGNGGFNGIVDLFGLAIIAAMFGFNGNGGFGGGGFGGGGNGAAYFANMVNNDAGRELLQNAITSQGEASRSAIQSLSTMIGQDFGIVNSAISNMQNSLCQIANQQGMSTLQVVNAIQAGNATLASQMAQCCCENRLLTTEQGYQAQIRTIEQTNQLGSQADRNTASIVGAIASLQTNITKEFCDVKEREMQEKINSLTANNTLLRSQIDNAAQTAQIAAMIAPLQAQVNDIAAKQLPTVPVHWPNIQAVNATPTASAGFGAGWGWGWGNGFGNGNVVF